MAEPASDLDRAIAELHRVLGGLTDDQAKTERLSEIAEQISVNAKTLVAQQYKFFDEFDNLSRKADTSEGVLLADIEQYQARRTEQRKRLFRLQDELRAELTDEEWQDVAQVLNRKLDAVARPTISEV